MMNTEKTSECIKIPLIVGVSGHKDIVQDENSILEVLDRFWSRLEEIVGQDTPIVLLSSIAEGADHYAALSARKRNITYCAVLPFACEDYRNDFSGPALQEFNEDLAGAFKVVTCPAAVGDYTAASDHIRKRSDILLTMWDGWESLDTARKPARGGTYYQIRTAFAMDDFLVPRQEKAHLVVNLCTERSQKGAAYHKEHGENEVCPLSAPLALEVISRTSSGLTARPFEEWAAQLQVSEAPPVPKSLLEKMKSFIFLPHGKSESQGNETPAIERVLKDLKEFNSNLPQELPADEYLRPKMETTPEALAVVKEDFCRYEYFNSKAGEHQGKHKNQFAWVAFWSVVAGIFGQAWGDLTFHTGNDAVHEMVMHIFILLYLLLCLLLFRKGKIIAREDRYSRYIRPRVIAELMRIKVFWELAGIQESFADHFLEKNDISWALLPLCNWDVASPPRSDAEKEMLESGKGFEAVKISYLADQLEYYGGYLLPEDPEHFVKVQKGEKCSRKRLFSSAWFKQYFRIYERLDGYFSFFKRFFTYTAFILSAVLLLVYAAALLWGFDHKAFLGLEIYREFVIGICPFLVATFGWLLEKANWDSLGNHYRTHHDLFRKTLDFVGSENHDIADKRQIIKEMILFAHEENAEWNNIKSNSKPEPML